MKNYSDLNEVERTAFKLHLAAIKAEALAALTVLGIDYGKVESTGHFGEVALEVFALAENAEGLMDNIS